jgi:hypothetical protein
MARLEKENADLRAAMEALWRIFAAWRDRYGPAVGESKNINWSGPHPKVAGEK